MPASRHSSARWNLIWFTGREIPAFAGMTKKGTPKDMKLGSLKQGRDGRLVVVSRDLAWCADASHLAPTLQAALDDWGRVAPQLELLAMDLEHGVIPRDRF